MQIPNPIRRQHSDSSTKANPIRRQHPDSATNANPIRRQHPDSSTKLVDELGLNFPVVDESVSLSTSRAPVDESAVDELGVLR